MNQAQLRPPQPVFKVLAALSIPALLFLYGPQLLRSSLSSIERHYLSDYIHVSVPTMAHTPRERSLVSVSGGQLHVERRVMSSVDYRAWMRDAVYGGQPVLRFFHRGLLVLGLIWLGVFICGVELDRKRQFRFRSNPRHLRGSRLVTRAQFRRHVKGEASGWWTETFAPRNVRPAGLGWRTEDYRES